MASFAELIAEEIEARGGDRGAAKQLADYLGEPTSQVYRWRDGQEPRFATALAVLERIGVEPGRIFDRWAVGEGPPARVVQVEGQVSAGVVRMAGTRKREVRADPDTWRESRFWGLTRGALVFLEVEGDSMWPEYAPGDLIACRAPVNPRELPNRTPCVFRDGSDGHTFKLLVRPANSTAVVAQPVNPAYPALLFQAHEPLHVEFVVLGKLRVA